MPAIDLANLTPPRMRLTTDSILDLPRFCTAIRPAGGLLAFEVEPGARGMVLSVREPQGPILAVIDVGRRYRGHDQFSADPMLHALTLALAAIPGVGMLYGIDPRGTEFLNLLGQAGREDAITRSLTEIAARYRANGRYDTTGLDESKDIERLRHDDPAAAALLLDPAATYSRVFRPRDRWCALVRHRVWGHVGFGQGATMEDALGAAHADFMTRWTVTPYMAHVAADAQITA